MVCIINLFDIDLEIFTLVQYDSFFYNIDLISYSKLASYCTSNRKFSAVLIWVNVSNVVGNPICLPTSCKHVHLLHAIA